MPAKKIIGLDFAGDCLRMVQLSRRSGRFCVENATSVSFDIQGYQEPESRLALGVEIRKAIEQAGFDRKAAVVTDMPNANVYYSTVTTDLTREEDLRRLIRFETEDDVPVPFEDLTVDMAGYRSTQDITHCLVAAAHRSEVQSLREMFSEAGMTCAAVSTDVNAIDAIARHTKAVGKDETAVLVHIENSRLIIGLENEGYLVGARSLAYDGDLENCTGPLITELERTFRAHPLFLDVATSKVVLSASEEVIHALANAIHERFDLPVKQLDLEAAFQQSSDIALNPAYRVALGMALMHLSSSGAGPNFIATDLSEASLKKDVWRASRVCACLVVLLVVLLGVRAFSRIHTLEEQHTRLNQEIQTVFSESLPEITRIVQPLPQMVEQVDRVRREYEILTEAVNKHASPLNVMQTISERFTTERDVMVSYMTLDRETVRITGAGGSYESVEALAADLRNASEFKDVKLDDITADGSSGRVQFRLSISRAL